MTVKKIKHNLATYKKYQPCRGVPMTDNGWGYSSLARTPVTDPNHKDATFKMVIIDRCLNNDS